MAEVIIFDNTHSMHASVCVCVIGSCYQKRRKDGKARAIVKRCFTIQARGISNAPARFHLPRSLPPLSSVAIYGRRPSAALVREKNSEDWLLGIITSPTCVHFALSEGLNKLLAQTNTM